MFRDHRIHCREAQSYARIFGGEIRVENFCEIVFFNSNAFIPDGESQVLSVCQAQVRDVLDNRIFECDIQTAAVRHGLDCVETEI